MKFKFSEIGLDRPFIMINFTMMMKSLDGSLTMNKQTKLRSLSTQQPRRKVFHIGE